MVIKGHPRVLVLTPWYATPSAPWSGTFVTAQTAALRSLGVECQVITVGSSPGSIAAPESGPDVNALAGAMIRRDWPYVAKVTDMVLAHAPGRTGTVALQTKLPVVALLHGRYPMRGERQMWFDVVAYRRLASILKRCHRIIAVSDVVRRDLPHALAKGTRVVHNGVDLHTFRPREAHSSDEYTLITVGNIIPTKGHAIVAKAVKRLARRGVSVRWQIIGTGRAADSLQTLVRRLGIAERVHFAGRLPPAGVAEMMSEAFLFVLPSRREAFGCVYLEAAACGVPVVAACRAGIEEVLRHRSSAYFVNPNSSSDVVDAITLLMRDAGLRQQLAEGGLRTARKYSWPKQASELLCAVEV